MKLTVYLVSGATLVFEGVENLVSHTGGFNFEYTSATTGITRKAFFNSTSTAGYSFHEEN